MNAGSLPRSSERFWFLLTLVGAFGAQFAGALRHWQYPASDYIAYAFLARHGEADLAHYPLYTASLALLDGWATSTVDAFYFQAFFWTGLATVAAYVLARRYASAPIAFAVSAFVVPFLLFYSRESHYIPQFLAYAMILAYGHSERSAVRYTVFVLLLAAIFLRLDLLLPLVLYGMYLIVESLRAARQDRTHLIVTAVLAAVIAGAVYYAGPAYQARSRVAFSQHLWIAEHERQNRPGPPGEYEPYVREHFGEPLVSPVAALRERPALVMQHVLGNVPAFFNEARDFLKWQKTLPATAAVLLTLAGCITLLVRLTTGGLRPTFRGTVPLLIPLVHVASVLLLYPRDVFFAGLLPWLVLGLALILRSVNRGQQLVLTTVLLLTAIAHLVDDVRRTPPERSVIATMRFLEEPSVRLPEAPRPRIVSDFDTRLVCLMLRTRSCEIVDVETYLAQPQAANLLYYSGVTTALRDSITLTEDVRMLNTPLGFFLETGGDRFFREAAFAADPYARRDRQRLKDLEALAAALETFRRRHGAYPQTDGAWFARRNCAGPSREDWIPGLAPEFIAALPRDPRDSTACEQQYAYKSNGQDYKIIALKPEAAGLWLRREDRRDAVWPAYSVHSDGARDW